MKRIHILSIDGGGIRGVIPARILAEIERRTGKPIWRLFDLIAGTSTGGILAVGLVCPATAKGTSAKYSAESLVNLYEENGSTIFYRSVGHAIASLWELAGPKFTADGIEAILARYFGDARLHEALAPVLVTAYNTQGPAPCFFKSWRAKQADTSLPSEANRYDYRLREVARATSAAPTFFPPLHLPALVPSEPPMCLVDGGVFANNPALCAWAEIPSLFPEADDVLVCSLGTGNTEKPIRYEIARGWGLARWAKPLVEILIDGVSDAVDYQLRELLPEPNGRRYFRFQTDLGTVSQEMDDAQPETIRGLLGLAKSLVDRESAALDELCQLLVQPR